jgi:hypothetical protein
MVSTSQYVLVLFRIVVGEIAPPAQVVSYRHFDPPETKKVPIRFNRTENRTTETRAAFLV